jgi:hypothetical protein
MHTDISQTVGNVKRSSGPRAARKGRVTGRPDRRPGPPRTSFEPYGRIVKLIVLRAEVIPPAVAVTTRV